MGESQLVLTGEFLNGETLFDEGNGTVEAIAQRLILSMDGFVLCLFTVIVTALYNNWLIFLTLERSHAVYRTTLSYCLTFVFFKTAEYHRTHTHCLNKGVNANVSG